MKLLGGAGVLWASATVLWATSGLSDAAWTGIAAIVAGLCTGVATIFQAKFSVEKAIEIALLKSEVNDLKDHIRRLEAPEHARSKP